MKLPAPLVSSALALALVLAAALPNAQAAEASTPLNIQADCNGCQSFEQFPNAVKAFSDAFIKKAARLGLPAQLPEIIIKSFKPRGVGSRLTWGMVGGKDEMSAEMRVNGMVINAQETARSTFTGYEGVAENLAEELAEIWGSRQLAVKSVTYTDTQASNYQTGRTGTAARAMTPDQAAMAKAMGLKVD